MPSTGDRLRVERERRHLTVQQAADATNIKADHIRAIEADAWETFSAPVYVRGFVKTYARFLRLDDRALATQLDDELAGRGDFEDADGGLRPPAQGPLDALMLQLALLRWQVVFPILLGGAVVIAGWWGWRVWQRRVDTPVPPPVGSTLYPGRASTPPVTLPLPPVTNAPVPPGR